MQTDILQIYSWNSNVIARPPAKRAVALAFMNSIGNMASIWTPFTYTDGTAPEYRLALGIVVGLLVRGLMTVNLTFLRLLLTLALMASRQHALVWPSSSAPS